MNHSKSAVANEDNVMQVNVEKSTNGSATLENWNKAKEALAKMEEQSNKNKTASSLNEKRSSE